MPGILEATIARHGYGQHTDLFGGLRFSTKSVELRAQALIELAVSFIPVLRNRIQGDELKFLAALVIALICAQSWAADLPKLSFVNLSKCQQDPYFSPSCSWYTGTTLGDWRAET